MNASSSISTRFDQFLASIRPTQKQRDESERQANILKDLLISTVNNNQRFFVERIFISGSAAKHTNLVRRGKGTFDIDLGVYYRSQGETKKELEKLLNYTYQQVSTLYPGKNKEDFHLGKNAVNVYFRNSGLTIDVVPIVRNTHLKYENSGWIPRLDGPRLTSITAHVDFVRTRTEHSNQTGSVGFNDLVRLMKWWNRKLPDHIRQCSYFYELVTAAALKEEGATSDWQNSLEHIFKFLSNHAFKKPIILTDYYSMSDALASLATRPKEMVVVLDAVNPENNLAHKWNENIKHDYMNNVKGTYELIRKANNYESQRHTDLALNQWCLIFGEEFRQAGH